jgi:hypothetical protein
MLAMRPSQGMLNIFLAYAELMLHSTGPAGGYLDTYATACERIAYVFRIYTAYAQLMLVVARILVLLLSLAMSFTA